jgi:aminoglycoside/choline kinase family phosphotransferase
LPRLALLNAWLADTLPGRRFDLSPASADASFRRYFRVRFDDGTPSRIVMDAPPAHEDVRPWLRVSSAASCCCPISARRPICPH